MKYKLLVFCLMIVSLSQLNAQGFDLTELKAPSSPAFTVLGVQPTEIARPTSFDAFKATLFNDFTDDDGITLPQNLALEFSPYWMFSHKNLTFEKLLDQNENNVWTNVMRSSSFSVATIDAETGMDSTITGTRMGIGYRTMLFNGSPSKKNREKLQKELDELKQIQTIILGSTVPLLTLANGVFTDFQGFIDSIPKEMEAYYSTSGISMNVKDRIKQKVEDEIIPFLKKENQSNPVTTKADLLNLVNTKLVPEITKISDSQLKAKAKTVQDLIDINGDNYKGFFLEFASAIALDFNDNEFSNSNVTKWSVWLTPSYRTENDKFEFLGVVRFMKNEVLSNVATDNFDVGAKLVFEKDKFSFSGEFIRRFQYAEAMTENSSIDKENDLKAVLNIEYKLSKNLLINYTFGENFNVNTENVGSFVSTVGISYNLGGNTRMIKLFQ